MYLNQIWLVEIQLWLPQLVCDWATNSVKIYENWIKLKLNSFLWTQTQMCAMWSKLHCWTYPSTPKWNSCTCCHSSSLNSTIIRKIRTRLWPKWRIVSMHAEQEFSNKWLVWMCSILRSLFSPVHLYRRAAAAFHSPGTNKQEHLKQKKREKELFHIHQIVMVILGASIVYSVLNVHIHWRSVILNQIAAAYARIIQRHLHVLPS